MVKEKWDGEKVEEVFYDTLGLFIYIKLKGAKILSLCRSYKQWL